jgi:hypothetical protein
MHATNKKTGKKKTYDEGGEYFGVRVLVAISDLLYQIQRYRKPAFPQSKARKTGKASSKAGSS